MYIGQGLGCTIEVKSITNPPQDQTEFLAIYDFGSSAGNTAPAMTYARNCILNRTPNGALAPVIDAIYVSHLDADHYNCLAALSDSIQYPTPQAPVIPQVANFFIGGIHNVNLLPHDFQATLAKFAIAPGHAFNLPTGYKHAGNDPYTPPAPPPAPPPPLPPPPPVPPTLTHNFSHYQLRLIPLLYRANLLNAIHQPAWPHAPANILINAGSIILLATVVDTTVPAVANPHCFSALFTGDATMSTLAEFVGANAVPLTQTVQGNFIFTPEYKFVTIPHHGSERTVRDLLNGNGPHTFHALNSFLGNYSPHSAVASAQSSNWGHPRTSVLTRFNAIPAIAAQVPAGYPPMASPPPLNPTHNIQIYTSPGNSAEVVCNRHIYTTVYNQGLWGRGFTATFSEANNQIDIDILL